jgi:hypothetical protein
VAEIDSVNQTMILTLSGNTAGSKILVLATPSLTQGTTFVKNKLRVIGVLDGSAPSIQDVIAIYVAKFGQYAPDANIYFATRVINANGQASPIETIKATNLE